jgi:hypothetical protein
VFLCVSWPYNALWICGWDPLLWWALERSRHVDDRDCAPELNAFHEGGKVHKLLVAPSRAGDLSLCLLSSRSVSWITRAWLAQWLCLQVASITRLVVVSILS